MTPLLSRDIYARRKVTQPGSLLLLLLLPKWADLDPFVFRHKAKPLRQQNFKRERLSFCSTSQRIPSCCDELSSIAFLFIVPEMKRDGDGGRKIQVQIEGGQESCGMYYTLKNSVTLLYSSSTIVEEEALEVEDDLCYYYSRGRLHPERTSQSENENVAILQWKIIRNEALQGISTITELYI
eukprot:scaffold3092_cov153-Skeletonema_marinoi.AAC.13